MGCGLRRAHHHAHHLMSRKARGRFQRQALELAPVSSPSPVATDPPTMKLSAKVSPHPALADHQAKPAPVASASKDAAGGEGKAGYAWERWTHSLKRSVIENVGGLEIRGAYWRPGDTKLLPRSAHEAALEMGLEYLGPAD